MDRRRFRPVRIAVGLTTATAVLGVGAIGYQMVYNQINGEADGQDLGEQFDSALNDNPAGSAIDQLDEAPVIGNLNDLAQNTVDRPSDMAEACLRIKDEIQVVEKFEPRYEAANALAAKILAASTDGEVLALYDAFLDSEGVDFYINSDRHPLKLSPIDWATKGVDANAVNAARISEEEQRYLPDLKIYAAGMVLGLGHFSQEFVDEQTDYMFFAGNVKKEATATAHEGILNRGMVIEFDQNPTLESVEARAVHELTHNFQHAIASKLLGFPFVQSMIAPYGTNVPESFRFAEDLGVDPQLIVDKHPEYFQQGPEQVFARSYSATNWLEYEATASADMLVTGGILGTDSPSWGSPFHENQLSLFACLDFAMPNFITETIAHQLETGLINNPDSYTPYFELSSQDTKAVLAT